MGGGQEYTPTPREEDPNRYGSKPDKRLPSSGDFQKEISPDEDTGGDALMSETAIKIRKEAKKTSDSTPQAPPTQEAVHDTSKTSTKSVESVSVSVDDPPRLPKDFKPRPSPLITTVFQSAVISAENQVLRTEVEQLRDENEELTEKVEHRKEIDRQAQRRRRAKQKLPKDSQQKNNESENATQTNMERVKELIEQRYLTNRGIAKELQIPVGTVADYAAQLANRGEVSPRKPGRKPKTK
jgi:hypothetical protein